ncbi:MAG: alpha/beta fold hydrolase [Deltaproteobacteria bacterium]|nr:alpha/beta fold hydrolase [Deltaproteobacteria bacterium]
MDHAAPWVLLHGFLGQRSSFDDVVALLAGPGLPPTAREERAVAAVQLPGHGTSPWFPPGWGSPSDRSSPNGGGPAAGFEDACDAVAARLPARFRLCGYSMGGRLSLGIAARHPQRVERLVLVGAHPGLEDTDERRARARWERDAVARLVRDGLPAFVDAWEALPLFATQHRLAAPQRERRRAERLAHTVSGIARALRHLGLAAMPSYRPAFASFEFPTTLVAGALDAKQVALDAETHRLVPSIHRVVVPDVGHDVVLESPGALGEILRDAARHKIPP